MSAEFLPSMLHSAAETRELDRLAVEEGGIPGIVLMKRAGRAAWYLLKKNWPEARRITVICGGGKNGGDGYIVAALAAQEGLAVQLQAVADPVALQGDAALARDFALAAGVKPQAGNWLPTGDVVVDALLGTGLRGVVEGEYARAIERMNQSGVPIFSLDIPSGLCSDTGCRGGAAVVATATVTFIALKRGLFTGAGPDCRGRLQFADLDIPAWIYDRVSGDACRLNLEALLDARRPYPRDAHKGYFGHVLLVGGELGFGGAVAMAAEAALRVGTGLVSVATRAAHVAPLLSRQPELMVHAVANGAELEPLLEKATAVIVGPGLGQGGWSEQLFQRVLASGKPLLIDADGLNLLAQGRWTPELGCPVIVTPHPGEAARLLNLGVDNIQLNRFATVRKLSERFAAEALLKGAGSLMASPTGGPVDVCTYGNPGMASGGMGDVLSGIVGGFLAQGMAAGFALRLGVCLHGAAADLAAHHAGEAGLVATDLLPCLRRLLNRRTTAIEEAP